jgi:hypothetical protein
MRALPRSGGATRGGRDGALRRAYRLTALTPFSRAHLKDHGGTTSTPRHPRNRRKVPSFRRFPALDCDGRYWARTSDLRLVEENTGKTQGHGLVSL